MTIVIPNDDAAPSGNEVDVQISDEAKAQLDRNRTWAVMRTFCLSYPKWAVSLFFWFASLSIAPVTELQEAAQASAQRLNISLTLESNAYVECTDNAFELMRKEMIEAANRENEQVFQLQAFDLELLRGVENTTNACALNTRKAQEGLFQWFNRLDQPFHFFNDTNCSADDRNYISVSLGQDFQKLETDVISIVGKYRDTSESSFDLVRKYAQERSDYDYNYFLRDRIEPTLELLEDLANTTLQTVQFSIGIPTIVGELSANVKSITDLFNDALERIDQLKERIRIFHENIKEWEERYKALQARAQAMIREVEPWLIGGIGVLPKMDANIFRWEGIALNPIHFRPEFFDYPIPNFDVFPEIDLMLLNFETLATEVITDLVATLAKQATAALQSSTMDILDQIRDKLTLEDYNPPHYVGSKPEIKTLDAEATYFSQIGRSAEAKTKEALDGAHDLRNSTSSDILPEVPEVGRVDHDFASDTTNFDYHSFNLPVLPFLAVLQAIITFVLNHGFWTEAIWSAFRLWNMKRKTEKAASAELPTITFGTVEKDLTEIDEEGLYNKAMAFFALIGQRLLLNPWVVIFLVLLIPGIFTVFVWYPHVLSQCAESNGGTWLATTYLVPYSINQASTQGNALHTELELDCFNRQRLICNQMFADSEVVYRKDVATLSSLQQSRNQSVVLSSRLERCIDTNSLDMNFGEACCGLEWYAMDCPLAPQNRTYQCAIDESVSPAESFRPMGSYLFDTYCEDDPFQWTLKDSRFDCQALADSCSHSPCHGANEELIRSLVVEADCQLELSFIRVFFFILVVVFHATMTNLVCPLLSNGVKQLTWEETNPHGIVFETQIDKEGKILKGNSAEKRAEKALAAIRKFVSKGWVQVVLAGVLLFVWFLGAYFFILDPPQYHY